jgi:ribosome maturation factor RimP
MSTSTSPRALQQRLISIVEPVCQAAGYELVELRFLLEQSGWTLRVAVDLPLDEHGSPDEVPSDRVDLEDCENLSRELSAVLDVEDPIPQMFHLEVSSPGIERPLRTAQHYRHFTGSEARIQLAAPLHLPSGDRRNFKGVLQGIGDDGAVAIECDGTVFRLPLDDIEHAKLVVDWDAVMKGKRGVGRPTAKPVKPGHRASHRRAEPRTQATNSTPASHRGSPQAASQAASQASPPSPQASASDADNKEQG